MKIAFVMQNLLSSERLSIMLLSALAKKYFPHVEVDLFVRSEGDLVEQLKAFKPDIAAFSTATGEHPYCLEAAKEIRESVEKKIKKKIFLIMGGSHCTFAPEVLKGSAFDAIGVGECDEAWVELLKALEAGRNINNLSNIVTQENFDEVIKPANLLKERYVKYRAINMKGRTCNDPINHKNCLDHLPFLDWDLYYRRTNFEKSNSLLKRIFMTRRGCPFHCTYCFNRVFNALYEGETIVHNYSVDRVIEECKWVGAHWPTEFWKFFDDTWPFSSKGKEGERLREFSEKWPREIGLPFFTSTRADLVARDPDILHLLKKAGCVSCTMAIEGGNDNVREKILERGMSDKDIIFSHRLAWDLGIKTFTNVIFSVPVAKNEIKKYDLPIKSIDRDIQSIELCLESRVHFAECPMLYPYPGTKIGEYCWRNGFFDGNVDNLPRSYQNISPFSCFTPYEKRMSQNLALLAMWCVYFGSRKNAFVRRMVAPLFFKLTTKILIRLPWLWCTKVYYSMYSVLQQWLCGAEIYRPKYKSPFKTMRQGFFSRFKYEFRKQFPK